MKKIILSLVFMLNYFSVQAINIKLLKGTHTIVPADYSPVMGLSFLEWGIAEQLYRLSPKFQNKQLAEALEKNPKAASKNPELARIVQTMESKKNSATENLVMEMYHIVRGSFKRTNAPDNPVRLLKPHHMGEILKIIQDGIKQLQDRDSLSQQQAAEKAGIDVKLAALTKENNRISGLISRTQAEMKTEIDPAAKKALEDLVSLYQKQIEDLKVQRKTLEETVKLAESKNLQDYMHGKMKFQLLTMLNNLGFKNDKGKVLKWNSFVDAIVGSLKESIGQDALYTPNTTQDLLLSYVLVKSDTRDDLQEYFRGFLGNDSFLLSPEEYSSENINQILATKTDASRFEEFADLLCAYTYKEKYDSSFPKIVDNKEVIFKGIFFADCMDTTMRMLANIGTYKPSLGKVGVVPEGLSLNPVVEHFYHSENGLCAQSAEVGNGKVHQAWAQAIENVPGCVYTQIGTGPQDAMDVANICDGVIPTGSLFTTTAEGKIAIDGALYEPYQLQLGTKTYTLAQKKVGEVTYLLVPKDSELVCCEMMPNNLNIVTGLDYIFNLHLYSNINELFEPDFVSKNFSKICEKLGWQPQIGIAELDKLGSIDIPIDTAAGKFFIHVFYKGHGYVTVEDIAKLHIALEVPETTHESTVAAIVAVGFKKITDLPAELQTDFLYKDVPVLNNDQRLNVLGQMIQDKNNVSEISQNYIRSLIVSFSFVEDTAYLERMVEDFGSILKQRGLSDFVVTVLQLHDVAYKSNVLLNSLGLLIEEKFMSIEQALPLIEKGMSSSNSGIQSSVKRVVRYLIHKGLITLDQALSLIEKGMSNSSFAVRYSAQNIMKILIDQGLITSDQALLLIKKGMAYANDNAMLSIQILINKGLIRSDQVIHLLPLLEKGMNDLNENIRSNALLAIKSLISKDLITLNQVPQLLLLLEKGMSDSNIADESISAIRDLVIKDLITLDQVPQLLPSLEKGMSDLKEDIQSKVMSVIENLIDKKLIISGQVAHVLPLIEQGMAGSSEDVSMNAMMVIKDLVDKNLITLDQVPQLLPLIEKGKSDFNFFTISAIQGLVDKNLITLDQVPQLLPLLEKGMNDSNIADESISVMRDLVIKDLITSDQLPKLLPLIEKGMNDSNQNIRFKSISIIKDLTIDVITPDQVPQLLPLLEKGMRDSNDFIRMITIGAIENLVDKKMITQSEVEHLKNIATDDANRQKLKESILHAPVSAQGRKVEKKAKLRFKLSTNQRNKIVQRIKMQKQMQQELSQQR